MTVDDARVRLTAALDDPTAARWLTPDYIAAIRLVLDALPTQEQLDVVFECKCGARWSGRYLTQENLVRHKHYCPDLSDRAIARALSRDTETPR